MTVEDLIEELRMMPQTATIEVQIRHDVSRAREGVEALPLPEYYEFVDVPIEGVLYDGGIVSIRLDENGAVL